MEARDTRRRIIMFRPSRNFITVSVTGRRCDLMCRHCQGRFLRHMAPAETPEALWELARDASARGVRGMLVSGGSGVGGAVPVLPFLDVIDRIGSELEVSVNLHTGFISLERIPALRGKHIDMVSFDIVGSPEVMRTVHGLDLEPEYFDKALDAFGDAGIKVVPHVTAGLDRGGNSGEENALEIIARHSPDFTVINALMSGDRRTEEASSGRLYVVVAAARELLPRDTALGIGCMRPRYAGLDPEKLVGLGVDSVAVPPKGLEDELRALGVEIAERDGCCSFYGMV